MHIFLVSTGEVTTEVTKWHCERLGYEVTLHQNEKTWLENYENFIDWGIDRNERVMRLDADTLINNHLQHFLELDGDMVQFSGFNMYKMEVTVTTPVIYSPDALRTIKDNYMKLHPSRPETSAWRLIEAKGLKVRTCNEVVALHGYNQYRQDILRHEKHIKERKQLGYDFELVKKLGDL